MAKVYRHRTQEIRGRNGTLQPRVGQQTVDQFRGRCCVDAPNPIDSHLLRRAKTSKLPMPLLLRQGIALDNAEDLQRLYKRVASVLKRDLPPINFDELARELKVNIGPRLIVELDTSAETPEKKFSYPAMLYSIGKIPNPKVPHRSEEEDRLAETHNRSHIPVYFVRARVTNKAACAISSCELYVTGINSTRTDLPFPRQELRWANSWFFEADPARNVVLPRGDVRPQHIDPNDSCHCDVCLYYDLQGPENLGEFTRGRVYLVVNRLPSATYSLEVGTHVVNFQLAARYSDGTSIKRDLSFNVNVECDLICPGPAA